MKKNESKIENILNQFRFENELFKIQNQENDDIESYISDNQKTMIQIIKRNHIVIFEIDENQSINSHLINIDRELIFSNDRDYFHSLFYENIQLNNDEINQIIQKLI